MSLRDPRAQALIALAELGSYELALRTSRAQRHVLLETDRARVHADRARVHADRARVHAELRGWDLDIVSGM